MAFTYTPQDAITFVKKYVKDIPVSDIDSQTCDMVSSIMYAEFPWKWTLTNIAATSIPLVDGTQDYSVPANLYRLLRARIVRTDTTPDEYQELDIKEFLSPNLRSTSHVCIRAVSHEESLGKFRLEMAASVPSGVTLELQGEYQINPTKITDANITSTFWFPDQYFHVFCEGLKWKWYEYADDSRAGNVTIDRFGRRQATGQAGKFYFALDQMRQAEDYGSGQANEFPDEAFGARMDGWVGIYGA